MMTSRCEYRLLLRQDNADLRLTEIGHQVGLASKERLERMKEKATRTRETIQHLSRIWIPKTPALTTYLAKLGQSEPSGSVNAADLLRRPHIRYTDVEPLLPDCAPLSPAVQEQVEISLRYEGYIEKEQHQVEGFRKAENRLLPPDTDYMQIEGLRIEARQKLCAIQPRSIGEASRISGVSPGDITVLLIWLTRWETRHPVN